MVVEKGQQGSQIWKLGEWASVVEGGQPDRAQESDFQSLEPKEILMIKYVEAVQRGYIQEESKKLRVGTCHLDEAAQGNLLEPRRCSPLQVLRRSSERRSVTGDLILAVESLDILAEC